MSSENSYKTSITLRIREKHLLKWKGIPKPSGFVNELVSDFFSGRITKLDLPDDILEKFNKCNFKDYLVSKLLIEYFNDNIMYINEFMKINSLQRKIGITSVEENKEISNINIDSTVNSHNDEEASCISEILDDTSITIENDNEEIKSMSVDSSLMNKKEEVEEHINEKPLHETNKKAKNILFKR